MSSIWSQICTLSAFSFFLSNTHRFEKKNTQNPDQTAVFPGTQCGLMVMLMTKSTHTHFYFSTLSEAGVKWPGTI